jgi:hypothetical protein
MRATHAKRQKVNCNSTTVTSRENSEATCAQLVTCNRDGGNGDGLSWIGCNPSASFRSNLKWHLHTMQIQHYTKRMMKAREHTNRKFANPRLPRNMAKLVEKRRKERVARSRLIANNQEYQRQLVNTTTAIRREKEIQRLTAYLNTPIPITTPTIFRSGQQAEDPRVAMDHARNQLDRLILAQEEYTRPLNRLRRISLV